MSNTIFDPNGVDALGLTGMSFDQAKAVYDKKADTIFNRIGDLILWFVRANDVEDSDAQDALKKMMAMNEMSLLLSFDDLNGLNAILKGTLETYDRIATDVCKFYQDCRQAAKEPLDVDTMHSRIKDIGNYARASNDFHLLLNCMQGLGCLLEQNTPSYQKYAEDVQDIYNLNCDQFLKSLELAE